MSQTFNLNSPVTIYPTETGWQRMAMLHAERYQVPFHQAKMEIQTKADGKGGYRDQLWVIINHFGVMFYNGSRYFEHMNIEL